MNESNKSSEGIRRRIEQTRNIFIKINRVFSGGDLSFELNLQLMRRYVLSVLDYGMEALGRLKGQT